MNDLPKDPEVDLPKEQSASETTLAQDEKEEKEEKQESVWKALMRNKAIRAGIADVIKGVGTAVSNAADNMRKEPEQKKKN